MDGGLALGRAAAEQPKPKKMKVIRSQSPEITLRTPFPHSAGADAVLSPGIDDSGYTSTDSISGDSLHHDE